MAIAVFACAHDGADLETRAGPVDDPAAGIEYRALDPEDFRATQPPRAVVRHSDHLGAYLCGSITGRADLEIEIVPEPSLGNYTITILDPDYGARLNPRCSWLNPKLDRNALRYTLEHEQIHFALLEIEARRVNRAIGELRVRIADPEQAAEIAREQVDALLDRASQRYVEQSRRFDREASHPSKQEAQSRWRVQVEALLAE